jgi:MFS family permease
MRKPAGADLRGTRGTPGSLETNMESQLKPASDATREYRDDQHDRGAVSLVWALVSGLALIALGVVLLLNNAGVLTVNFLTNWWALFILLPAIGAFVAAYESWRRARAVTGNVISNIVGGLILTFVAGMFLFNLDWGVFWPVFIILAGVGVLSRGMLRQNRDAK